MSKVKNVQLRRITRIYMKLLRIEHEDGSVRFYNATGANMTETAQILQDAIEGKKTEDEITNEKHKELCAKWWAQNE